MTRRLHITLITLCTLAACATDSGVDSGGTTSELPVAHFDTAVDNEADATDADLTPSQDAATPPPDAPSGDVTLSDTAGHDTPLPPDTSVVDITTDNDGGLTDTTGPELSDADAAAPTDGASDTLADSSDGASGVEATSCEGLDNGTPCEDGDLCTVGDTCVIGTCQSGEAALCNGQGPCRTGTCAPNTGQCSYVDAPQDAPCDNGDACTATSVCDAGLCIAVEPLVCPDQGPCQFVSCDPTVGCVAEFLTDGLPCDAPCHDIAQCVEGVCVGEPGAIPPCPPSDDPCVESWLCDMTTGDCTVMVPKDAGANCDSDESECTLEACDGEGVCLKYDDDICEFESSFDPCWDYACNPDTGCQKSVWAPNNACPGPVCGDSYCLEGEDCFSCPGDCGSCCGDGTCTPGHEETCNNCWEDCGLCCGNGLCDYGETCFSCNTDCGQCCGDGACVADHVENCLVCPGDCGDCCGNGTCDADLGENCFGCPDDCGGCCGNGECDYGETCLTCEGDCGECCTSGTCDPALGDNCQTCPEQCGECCGNGTCDPEFGEDCAVCAQDCGECCGDGVCDPTVGETCGYCPEDCGSCCGNALCDPGEDCEVCPGDCGLCACGNGLCCAGETCESCETDCGSCPAANTVLGTCSDAATTGIQRDCGWAMAGEQLCTPNETVTIACHGEGPCNLGMCDGDAMLRVCNGSGNACTSSEALAQNDNACGSSCPYLTFLCPASGQLTVLTAAHEAGQSYQCIWSTYPDTPDATLPCDEPTCGVDRDCGWVRSAVLPCTAGIPLQIGCAAEGGLGNATGDPMIRVCAGEQVACSAADALASDDDQFAPDPVTEFTCPVEGAVTVLTAPKCTNDPYYSCDLCAACPSCTPSW